ncbi:hypothetical protein EGW08_020087 [Elysia chlorotica]|uniref:HSF-type DNA-binding domain-containing protein n=1 Tax=Elysia chlorotica TaxID=188477 RepID=A0A433SSF0_ELYCH|nr:hypothetical protein EGW08_020087 [Elysia chlorotica]
MAVVNDGIIIRWADDNNGIIVQEKEFEQNVMQMYPGFVQVDAFHNLRRLFRDYNFKFRILQRKSSCPGLVLEFRHPNFSRENFDQLSQVKKRQRFRKLKYLQRYQRQLKPLAPPLVKCKRKINFQIKKHTRGMTWNREIGSEHRYIHSKPTDGANHYPSVNLSDCMKNFNPNNIQHFSVGAAERIKHANMHSKNKSRIYELFSGAEMDPTIKSKRKSSSRFVPPESPVNVDSCVAEDLYTNYTKEDYGRQALMQVYAKNELNEEEFWELMTRKSYFSCRDMSWEMIKEYIDRIVCHESSPLHFKGFYYNVPLSEL